MACRRPEPLHARHRLEDFQCGETALDDWLKRFARQAVAAETARVFVATTADDIETVIGYFAIAAAEVRPEDATPRTLKGQPQSRALPAVLLARLAGDARHRGLGLGASLLKDALLRSAEAADVIGARVLLVHAKHDGAKEFYRKYGFESSPTDPLNLQMLMKDVRAAIR